MPADLVEVGRVIDAYGIRGWVKLAPFNDPQDSVLRTCRRWWLPDGTSLEVDRARVHGATVVAHPSGFPDRTAAERLRGLTIRISRADFPASSSDEYYWVDLVGCRVSNPGGEELGVVTSVEDHGAHPILLLKRDVLKPDVVNPEPVKPKSGEPKAGEPKAGPDESPSANQTLMIPFVSNWIVEVDLAQRRIIANWELDY